MARKAIACIVIVAASTLLFMGMRSSNRAAAADGNCYSELQGPSSPTVCD